MMTPIICAFLVLVLITCGSSLVMLWTKNILHAALAMFMTMLGLAGLYVLAYADVMAVSHLMIYVGGVLILILFGIMLTNQKSRGDKRQNDLVTEESSRFWPILLGSILFAGFVYIFSLGNFSGIEIANSSSKLSYVGLALLTEYAMPFELVGIYLLIALIGATYIAKNHE
ncbi:NADH-quinone oxidoreductase subunit J [Aquirufa sp.]|jgi:NADH:ubiquinone oxidoreductase subunit 6 (subunit J)|uniref:NADH-quinone oxidoreductase subunit J n=1 Tax=Aquirufa sp. TaxID=2676249 RepID=UPI0037C03597